MISLMALLFSEPSGTFMVSTNNRDSLISRSRNNLTARFLESDCEQLLFLDNDLEFPVDGIKRLLYSKHGMTGGLYYGKSQGVPKPILNAVIPDPGLGLDLFKKVRYVGTGMMCIKRWVLEVMKNKLDIAYHPDDSPEGTVWHDFFPDGLYTYSDGTRRHLSEDWFICQRAWDLGIDVWCDPTWYAKHHGSAAYPLEGQLESHGVINTVTLGGDGRPVETPAAVNSPATTLNEVKVEQATTPDPCNIDSLKELANKFVGVV